MVLHTTIVMSINVLFTLFPFSPKVRKKLKERKVRAVICDMMKRNKKKKNMKARWKSYKKNDVSISKLYPKH